MSYQIQYLKCLSSLRSNAIKVGFCGRLLPRFEHQKAERNRRAEKGVQRIRIFGKNQPVPRQWKKFLSRGENKESLMMFLGEHWRTYNSSQMQGVSSMFVTSKEKCHNLSCCALGNGTVVCEKCVALESDHEEADTRILLHAKHAMNTCDSVIIKSPDTDVFILCTAMQRLLGSKDLFFMTGTGKKSRTLHMNAVSNALGENCVNACQAFMLFQVKIIVMPQDKMMLICSAKFWNSA